MGKKIIALYLASVTVAAGLVVLPLLSPQMRDQRPVKVTISANVRDLVTAIASVHRTDVDIQMLPHAKIGTLSYLWSAPFLGLAVMVMSALVGAVYKRICGWMKVSPEL
jgi:hypothetical protein